ncbi:hypothetical protein NHX12_029026 [Muraenolepis orangiensis]|uniref:Uncharacterized protein n=1 Tax=Muraenolepis orangiensis TaxID=630683 RepID=A0A9Q0IN32_9TELE|nr:hypothetical protein NHX12_029026 [Muraenolepis orangiensis]
MELDEPGNSEPPISSEHGKLDIDILPIGTTDAPKKRNNPGNHRPFVYWDHPLLNDSNITEKQKLRYVVDWAQNLLNTRSEMDNRKASVAGKQVVPRNMSPAYYEPSPLGQLKLLTSPPTPGSRPGQVMEEAQETSMDFIQILQPINDMNTQLYQKQVSQLEVKKEVKKRTEREGENIVHEEKQEIKRLQDWSKQHFNLQSEGPSSCHKALDESKQTTVTANLNFCYTSERAENISVYERYLLYMAHLDQLRLGRKPVSPAACCQVNPSSSTQQITDRLTRETPKTSSATEAMESSIADILQGRDRNACEEPGECRLSDKPPLVVRSEHLVPVNAWEDVEVSNKRMEEKAMRDDEVVKIPADRRNVHHQRDDTTHLSLHHLKVYPEHEGSGTSTHPICTPLKPGVAVELRDRALTEGWLRWAGGHKPQRVSLYRCSSLSITPGSLERFFSLCTASLEIPGCEWLPCGHGCGGPGYSSGLQEAAAGGPQLHQHWEQRVDIFILFILK